MLTSVRRKKTDRETAVTYESDDSELRDVYELDQNIEDTKNHLSCTVEMLQTVTKKMQVDNAIGSQSGSNQQTEK